MREIRDMHVIQIDVTNRCEHRCSNCTRMLAHHPRRYDMTPEQFERAVKSLLGFPGIVGVFGGNPTLNPHFPELCAILRRYVGDKGRRGLWSNRLNGHGPTVRETFGYFNLNVHQDATAADEIRRELPGVPVYGEEPCWHKPSLVALRDVLPAEQWADVIDMCPIQTRWSAIISPTVNGSIGAYCCEIMSAWDWVYGTDTSVAVEDGWWRRPLRDYTDRISYWCPQCGLCLDLPARRDGERKDDVSATHAGKAGKRGVLFEGSDGLADAAHEHGDSLDYTLKRSNPDQRRLQK